MRRYDDERRRPRRFPLFSVVTILVLGFSIGYQSYLDVDVPRRALSGVGAAFSQFASGFHLFTKSLAEGFTIVDRQQDALPASKENEIPFLVNNQNPLPEGYVTENLVNMRQYCDESIVYIKGSEILGNKEAVDALLIMLQAGIAQGETNWQVSAGYRSVEYQQKVFDEYVYDYRQQGLSGSEARNAASRYVAAPGCSEHHTGLAFDITIPGESFSLTHQCQWLTENCWDYGFILRYTEDKESITGFGAEAWHFRYVGLPHSQVMRDNNWCLEEYVEFLKNQDSGPQVF